MSSAKPDNRTVRVTIFNQMYTLVARNEPRELEDLAHTVDRLMVDIASRTGHSDSLRIAILACLHLADRLQLMDNDLQDLRERVGRKSEEFSLLLEQALERESTETRVK
jgi:cell division protein ZapA